MPQLQPPPDAPTGIDPCPHMERLVSALADGSLRGPARWYTRFHILSCMRCREALRAFIALRDRLLRMGKQPESAPATALSPDRRERLMASLDAVDRGNAQQPPYEQQERSSSGG